MSWLTSGSINTTIAMPPSRTSTSETTKSAAVDAAQLIEQHRKGATDASVKDEGLGKAGSPPGPPGPSENQSTLRVVCLIVSAFVAMFLVALDRTIISTVCVSYTSNPI